MALASGGCALVPTASSSRKAAALLSSLFLIHHLSSHVHRTEGRDNQHSLAAAPGLRVLPGFTWVKVAFPQAEKGKAKNPDTFGKCLMLGYILPVGTGRGGTLRAGLCPGLCRLGGQPEAFQREVKRHEQVFPMRKTTNTLLQRFSSAKCIC